ncbi:MAG: hypothetical protein JW860_00770 [Sedimentisphaerales bacterium]|nr:hypothetical protein [Sedimentisphaerales bacterium]
MKNICCILSLLLAEVNLSLADTHENFQAVLADGSSAYTGLPPVTLEGIILNSPEEILDPEPNATGFMGAMWQIYIQGEGTDHAGTAVWIGQKYGNLPGNPPEESYSEAEWLSELCRINHDETTGYLFNTGDRIRVSGYFIPFNGKNNINETHSKDPFFDFTLELLEPGAGLPQPEVVTLNELKDVSDQFIFDVTRQSGCEYYQSRLIRINSVSFVDPNDWAPGATLTITNGIKTFPVLLGRGTGIKEGTNNLVETFDVVGILDQEDNSDPYTGGYRIWVPNYDGNGLVLRDRGYQRGNLSGDINGDGTVDLSDFIEYAADWLKTAPGVADCY